MEMVMDPVVARWTAQETEVRSRLNVDACAPASLAGLTGMELFAAIFAGAVSPPTSRTGAAAAQTGHSRASRKTRAMRHSASCRGPATGR